MTSTPFFNILPLHYIICLKFLALQQQRAFDIAPKALCASRMYLTGQIDTIM